MEMEYGDEATRRLHQEGVSYGKGFDRQALMRLNRIKAALDQRDLSALKGNRLESSRVIGWAATRSASTTSGASPSGSRPTVPWTSPSRTTTERHDDDHDGEPGDPPGRAHRR
jgi:hypothetical protein